MSFQLVGFKSAYCSAYENEDCSDIYVSVQRYQEVPKTDCIQGTMDIMSETLVEMAQKIVKQG